MEILHNQPIVSIQNSNTTTESKDISTKNEITVNQNSINSPNDEVVDDKRRVLTEQEYLKLPEIQAMIVALTARDLEVRAHEMAHQMVGGSLAGAMSFSYQIGPDNKLYAIGGEVPISIETSENPQETISNMQQIKAAALAPSNPSGADLQIASTASKIEMDAKAQLNSQQEQEKQESKNDKIDIKNSQDEKENLSEQIDKKELDKEIQETTQSSIEKNTTPLINI